MIVLFLGLLGCPKPVVSPLDTTLPEANETVDARAPTLILSEMAANPNAGPRGLALRYLVLASDLPAGGEWGRRGLWDPDGWVQRQVGTALAEATDPESRSLLLEWIVRPTADPYARGSVALRLKPDDLLRDAVVTAVEAETTRWRQAPLALAAAVLGHAPALELLTTALSRGDIALEPAFLTDLARLPDPAVPAALEEGAGWVEEELALAYGAARLRLGDAAGEQTLRRALDADLIGTRLEAVLLAADIDHPAAEAILRKASGSRDLLVRAHGELATAALRGAPLDAFTTHVEHTDPEVRTWLQDRVVHRVNAEPELGKKERRELAAVVGKGLVDAHQTVRAEAVLAARALKLDRALAERALTDPTPATRLHAAGWLATE